MMDLNSRPLILEPGRTERNYWRDLWAYRELFVILAWRDVSVRYKQTVIGVLWAILRPFITMVVFTIVFGRLAGLSSEETIPYPLIVFAGMLPWFLCSSILSDAGNSLVGNAHLISKVYFPRLVIPGAAATVALIDFLCGLAVFALMMICYGHHPSWSLILLPFFVVLAIFASLGPALIAAALNVRYRDFRFIVPFVVQIGLYVSPVGFSSSVVPEKWRLLYSINPMVGVIDGFRWCLLGGQSAIYMPGFLLSIAVALALMLLGLAYFRQTERTFADVI